MAKTHPFQDQPEEIAAEVLVICSAKPTMRTASPPVLRNSPRAQGNLKKWRKPRGKFMGIPFGKHTNNYEKSPFLLGISTISTGPFSIAFCMFTRPGIMDFWRLSWESMENTVKKSLHSEMHWGNHSDMSGNITETIHLWGESSHSNTISTMNVWWICLMEISWRYNG